MKNLYEDQLISYFDYQEHYKVKFGEYDQRDAKWFWWHQEEFEANVQDWQSYVVSDDTALGEEG